VSSETRVFISYSHADENWLKRLQVHLRPLTRDKSVVFDDTLIEPGEKWREKIDQALLDADVAVLLVSADFFGSDFIATTELPPLLAVAKKNGTKIVPVIVSPSRFTRVEALSQFESVNDPAQPLVDLSLGESERVFDKVSQIIEATVAHKRIASLEKRVESQQEIINQLVVFSMAFYLFEMLKDFSKCEKGDMTEYLFRKTPEFESNLRWLRDHGYIHMIKIRALRDRENIAKQVKLTPVGRYYVDLRLRYESARKKVQQ
jgi:hypothetical protein